ncbi:MAG: hypothetical protein ABIE42_06755 [Candidatus Eisenbacteria bacterium]
MTDHFTPMLRLRKGALIALAWLAAFAVAMAYMEAAVVAYLRLLYYPDGFVIESAASLEPVPPAVLAIEIGREVATIVMLAAVALLSAGKNWWERLAHFMWAFALWDIFYYVWLYVLLRWPSGATTIDVLFLIPVPWIAPVFVPIVVSLLMIGAALAILRGIWVRGATGHRMCT